VKSKHNPWAWKNGEVDVRRAVLVEAKLSAEPVGAIILHNKTIFVATTDITWTNAGKVSKVSSWQLAIIDQDALGSMSDGGIPTEISTRSNEVTCLIKLKWFSLLKPLNFGILRLDETWLSKSYVRKYFATKHKGNAMGYVLLFFLDRRSDKFHVDLYKCSQRMAEERQYAWPPSILDATKKVLGRMQPASLTGSTNKHN